MTVPKVQYGYWELITKGANQEVVEWAAEKLDEAGYRGTLVTLKSDQEEAIKSVVAGVGKLRAAGGGGKFIVENSPVGASASNGVIECGIQSIEG